MCGRAGSLDCTDPHDRRATDRALALHRGLPVLQLDRGRVLDLPLGSTFHAIALDHGGITAGAKPRVSDKHSGLASSRGYPGGFFIDNIYIISFECTRGTSMAAPPPGTMPMPPAPVRRKTPIGVIILGVLTILSGLGLLDRKSTRLNSSHIQKSRMPSSA